MELLKKIAELLNIDKTLKKLVFGEIKIPYHDDYNPVNNYWYQHPPCLIPLFLGYGASYKGVIHHFFTERKNTFVELNLEYGYIIEKALNFKQLSVYLILPMIISEDELTDDIIKFAKEINFEEYKEVNKFSIKHGDDTNYFNEMIYFENNLPLDIVKDISTYKGDFPSSYDNLNEQQILNACSFEISKAAFEDLKSSNIVIPEWLRENTDKIKLFEKYVINNQLKEAWLTLNSKGWLLKDVAKALETLKSITKENLFHLVADNWINGWKNSTFKDGNY
jgi:hypothetical protein